MHILCAGLGCLPAVVKKREAEEKMPNLTWMAAMLYSLWASGSAGLLGSACTGDEMVSFKPDPSSRDVTATGPTACSVSTALQQQQGNTAGKQARELLQ